MAYTRLESVYTSKAYPEFESRSLRKIYQISSSRYQACWIFYCFLTEGAQNNEPSVWLIFGVHTDGFNYMRPFWPERGLFGFVGSE